MLGLRFSRLVHAAIASGALVLGACSGTEQDTDTDTDTDATSASTTEDPTTGPPVDPPPPPPPGDITPPALVSVAFVDPFTLQLSFTEPVAPVDTVNPKRFRLSFAVAYLGNYGGQPNTSLRDPRFYNFTEYCPPLPPGCYDYYYEPYYCYYGPYCYYQASPPILAADLINHYADPNSVLISLTEGIRPSLCNMIDAFQSDNGQAVLHLHYADGGLAQITDLAGLPLPALGETWIKNASDFYYYPGVVGFSNFNPFLPIPCPF